MERAYCYKGRGSIYREKESLLGKSLFNLGGDGIECICKPHERLMLKN